MDERDTVIGESEGYPVRDHLDQTPLIAARRRMRREVLIGRPCCIVPMAAWPTDPLRALRGAQAARLQEPGTSVL